MNIDNALLLLEEFNKIPKRKIEPTFLEICNYPKRRFEEICSRILCFYFNPLKEHGLKNLFIDSLFELLIETGQHYQDDQIKIIAEDNADGKRIDLVIYSPDFIIGIENKITAPLYNPLNAYKKRLEEYSIKNIFKLVLSLKTITKKEELELINRNEFKAITYCDFFEVIKKNIGQYISTCNQKYLGQLFDFIQTLENMKSSIPTDKKLADFFFDNSDDIEKLIQSFRNHNDLILNKQKDRISELREKISTKTGKEWWAWQGWDLGYNSFSSNMPKIGIESSYKETKTDVLGEFRIYITTWNLKDWLPFEKTLTDRFPNNFLDKVDNRVYLHMDLIKEDDEELIIEKLNEYFEMLNEITGGNK